MASRRLGGGEDVIEAMDDEISKSGAVGKKIRKSMTLSGVSCSLKILVFRDYT